MMNKLLLNNTPSSDHQDPSAGLAESAHAIEEISEDMLFLGVLILPKALSS
jgi:hypothetical protein